MKSAPKAIPAIIHEFWRTRSDQTSAVKLRVTFKKISRTWILKYPDSEDEELKKLAGQTIALSKEDFAKVIGKKVPKKFNALSLHLAKVESHAMDIIKDIPVFTFEKFEKQYFSMQTDKNDLFSLMAAEERKLREDGKISTANTFECALNSLKAYTGKESYPFERLDVKFLKDYEKWMITPRTITKNNKETTKVNGRTTVGIYLRNVRTIFNQVKPAGIPYPFGKSKQGLYAIPKGRNTKKALTQADVAKIANYKPVEGTIEHQCRDYWLFSYLCNGINIKDMARLKYSNIHGEKILLIRAKTANSVDEESAIEIVITKPIRLIIEKWGIKPEADNQYIFPILAPDMTPEQEYRAIQQTVQNINRKMTGICQSLSIDRATTYWARHSFATVLKRSGASLEFISESLGHRNRSTTESYLANFEDDEKKKWANMLLPETDDIGSNSEFKQ